MDRVFRFVLIQFIKLWLAYDFHMSQTSMVYQYSNKVSQKKDINLTVTSYRRNGRAQKWYCLRYGLESVFKSCRQNTLFSSLLHPDQLLGLPDLPCKCTSDSFLGVKVARVWIWHLTTSIGEIKTAYSYTSSTPYITIVWRLIKKSDITILSIKKEKNITYKNSTKFNQNTVSQWIQSTGKM